MAYRRTDLSRLRGRGVRTRTGRERPGLMDGGWGADAICCLGVDPPFIRSAVLREDHHNCVDNAQTDEALRKAANGFVFLAHQIVHASTWRDTMLVSYRQFL